MRRESETRRALFPRWARSLTALGLVLFYGVFGPFHTRGLVQLCEGGERLTRTAGVATERSCCEGPASDDQRGAPAPRPRSGECAVCYLLGFVQTPEPPTEWRAFAGIVGRVADETPARAEPAEQARPRCTRGPPAA